MVDAHIYGEKLESSFIHRKRVDETLSTIRIDGIEAYSSSTTYYAKAFWIFITSVATVVLLYELYKTLRDYIESPLMTSYKVEPRQSMVFPELYFCTTNFAWKTIFNKQNETTKRDLILYRRLQSSSHLILQKCQEPNSSLNHSYVPKTERIPLYKIFELMKAEMSLKLDQTFVDCSFRTQFQQKLKCSNLLTPVIDADFGVCYVLKVNEPQVIGSQGLLLVVNINKLQYAVDDCLEPDTSGVAISISERFNPADKHFMLVTTGTYNRIHFNAEHLTFQNFAKKSRCMEPNRWAFKVLNVTYSQSACQRDCYASSVVQYCNCIPIFEQKYVRSDLLYQKRFCDIEDIKSCVVNLTKSQTVLYEISNCSTFCYSSCEIVRYPATVTSMPLVPNSYPPSLQLDNFAVIQVSYAKMQIEKFQQNPSKTVYDFVAGIGGQVNLWLGASMLGLLQLPVALCTLCGYALNRFYNTIWRSS